MPRTTARARLLRAAEATEMVVFTATCGQGGRAAGTVAAGPDLCCARAYGVGTQG